MVKLNMSSPDYEPRIQKRWILVSGARMTVLVLMLLISACTNTQIYLANLPSNLGAFDAEYDVEYGNKPWQLLDVYYNDEPELKPVVLFIYGGKWKFGDKDNYKFAGDAFTARGYVAVVADYIKYPSERFPQFVVDEALAIKWIYENIEKFGGDKNNIFIVGHSAGAHIGGLLAADDRYVKAVGVPHEAIKGMIGMAGPYAFNPGDHHLTKVFGGEENFPDSQVINFINGNEPPFLLLHGKKDDVVTYKQSETLAERIRETGGEVELKIYDELDHRAPVAALTRFFRRDRDVLPDIVKFIEEHRD